VDDGFFDELHVLDVGVALHVQFQGSPTVTLQISDGA